MDEYLKYVEANCLESEALALYLDVDLTGCDAFRAHYMFNQLPKVFRATLASDLVDNFYRKQFEAFKEEGFMLWINQYLKH